LREWVHQCYVEMLKENSSIRPGAWICEPGCGTAGASAILAAENRVMFVGLDIDPKALEIARSKIQEENVCDRCDLILGDMFYLPLRDGACELVWNAGVLEHFKQPQDEDAIMEMARVTKPSGEVFLLVPNRFHIGAFNVKVLYKLRGRRHAFGYQRDYSVWEIERKIRKVGLVVKKSFGFKLGLILMYRKLAHGLGLGKIYDTLERTHTKIHKIFGEWIVVVGIKQE